ncbi:HAD family hydrolase [Candidatus Nitrosacidococcus sp. I8]|uniref:HAD family hydrolase n=1 Tax=Candidatus Nitrosacidococcus sp. I8 TaxID=2942908 RepID=UPI0022273534|nr:HAD family hydrolase [Candidatus Nitrosacidococcus sp. I8]CAH9018039.1 5-amino-6-(5-phospho-D-ribitylamino)uracil phosphatase YigB [Candidatus Nitrosacidococcus sp. I8]
MMGRYASQVKLISFDLDETVWPSVEVLRKAEETQFQWLEKKAPRLTLAHNIESLREHRQHVRKMYPEMAYNLTAMRMISLNQLLQEFSYTLTLAEEAISIFLEARNQVTPYPDVIPVLDCLIKKYILVSLTNGNAEVSQTPLKNYFQISLTPAIAGTAKPDPDIFHQVLKKIKIEPYQAIHVGDHPTYDIAAAQQVGMRAIWINRNDMVWPEELPPPDGIINNLYELEQWL